MKTFSNWQQSVRKNSVLKKLGKSRAVATLFVLAVLCIVLGLLSPNFFTTNNWANILRQTSVTAIAATGMTLVIVTGGIDLSIGSTLAFSAVILGSSMLGLGSMPIAILLCLLTGTIIGLLNGVLIAKLKLPPFIVTLGMMSVARGGALVFSGGVSYSLRDPVFRQIGDGSVLGIPIPAIILLVIALGTHVFLTKTKVGYYIFALGGNEEASRLSGINVQKIKVLVYGFAGFAAALAAVVISARLGSGQPIGGNLLELDAIAAVVIGGTSLSGGVGTVLGSIIGAVIMTVIKNGLNLLNVNPFWQQIAVGLAVITAVAIDKIVAQKRQ